MSSVSSLFFPPFSFQEPVLTRVLQRGQDCVQLVDLLQHSTGAKCSSLKVSVPDPLTFHSEYPWFSSLGTRSNNKEANPFPKMYACPIQSSGMSLPLQLVWIVFSINTSQKMRETSGLFVSFYSLTNRKKLSHMHLDCLQNGADNRMGDTASFS